MGITKKIKNNNEKFNELVNQERKDWMKVSTEIDEAYKVIDEIKKNTTQKVQKTLKSISDQMPLYINSIKNISAESENHQAMIENNIQEIQANWTITKNDFFTRIEETIKIHDKLIKKERKRYTQLFMKYKTFLAQCQQNGMTKVCQQQLQNWKENLRAIQLEIREHRKDKEKKLKTLEEERKAAYEMQIKDITEATRKKLELKEKEKEA